VLPDILIIFLRIGNGTVVTKVRFEVLTAAGMKVFDCPLGCCAVQCKFADVSEMLAALCQERYFGLVRKWINNTT
jgi:hypothetical protein